MRLGKVPLCNGRPERAPHIGNFCFPLCWRCTSILVGFFAWYTIQLMLPVVNPLIGMILIAPCAFDGFTQYVFDIESTNNRRIITGLLCGIGLCILSLSLI